MSFALPCRTHHTANGFHFKRIAMASHAPLTLSVAELDATGCCDPYAEHRPALLAANPDPNHPLSLDDAAAAGCSFTSVRDLLFPIAKLAQTDPGIRARLTCLINDYAIRSLPTFEARFPGDLRPRYAIEATQQFASGELSDSEWKPAALAGLRAWAAFYAPAPIYANGIWAAVSSGKAGNSLGWNCMSDDKLDGWLGWAEWATLALKLHLVEQHGGVDAYDSAVTDPPWTIERLVAWSRSNPPTPLPIPPIPAIEAKPVLAQAKRVGTYDLDWSFFSVFPEGLTRIDGVLMERNAFVTLPEGVQRIGQIYMCDDAGELVVPDSVRRIDELTVSYGSGVKLPVRLETIGSLVVDCGAELALPNGVQNIRSIKTWVDLDLPLSIRQVGSVELVCDDEDLGPEHAVTCGAIEIRSNAKNLSFPDRGEV